MAFADTRNYNVLDTTSTADVNFNYPVFAGEKILNKKARQVWSSMHPLLRYIWASNGGNFKASSTITGNGILEPLVGEDLATPADGVTDANELTGQTANETVAATMAEFPWSHYRGNFTVKASEAAIAMGGSRMDFWDMKLGQLMESFRKAMSDDVAGSSNATRSNLIGLQYALNSGSSAVGGITLATAAAWQPYTTTGAGAFTIDLIDDMMDNIESEDRAKPDLILLARGGSGNPNLYGKLRATIDTQRRIVNESFSAKYGTVEMVYRDAICQQDPRTTAGTIQILSTETWTYHGQAKPKLVNQGGDIYQNSGPTDARVYVWNLFCALSCCDLACNGLITGVS